MNRVIGVVCEGPTDYEAIKRIVDMVTQEENDYRRLQPDESLAGRFGNGWKGVWKWCENHGSILHDYMRKVTPQIDCLIVHMDGDVSRKEKEVHCACNAIACEQAGIVHPLDCPICKDGKCPVVFPCADHETGRYAFHLRDLIAAWLRISAESPPIIITIPCDSIDTWVAAAYGDLANECETHPDPWHSIIARGAHYHSTRIHGDSKKVSVYRILADNLCKEWGMVKGCCPQAQAFETDISQKLLS